MMKDWLFIPVIPPKENDNPGFCHSEVFVSYWSVVVKGPTREKIWAKICSTWNETLPLDL